MVLICSTEVAFHAHPHLVLDATIVPMKKDALHVHLYITPILRVVKRIAVVADLHSVLDVGNVHMNQVVKQVIQEHTVRY